MIGLRPRKGIERMREEGVERKVARSGQRPVRWRFRR